MTTPLVRLIYRSRIAVVGDRGRAMDEIVRASVRNNRRDDVTGVIALAGDRFVQVIEGREDRIDALMDRLRNDPRHTDIDVLARWAVRAHLFPGWWMARVDLGALSPRAVQMLATTGTAAQITSEFLGVVQPEPNLLF